MRAPIAASSVPRLSWISIVVPVLSGVLLAGLSLSLKLSESNLLVKLTTFFSIAPVAAFLVALGLPNVQGVFTKWWRYSSKAPLQVATGLALCYLLGGIGSGFDPYAWLLTVLLFVAVLMTARSLSKSPPGYCDMLLWLLLLVPFDYRLTDELWFGAHGIGYIWWSLALSTLMIVIWRDSRGLPGLTVRLLPKVKDITVALVATVLALLLLLPLGISVDFINYSPPESFLWLEAISRFIGLLFTVAIPEELFFRGVLMMALLTVTQKLWLSVLLSSLFFGIFHWNNVDTLQQQLAYCSLATIAGFFYAQAYLRSDNNLLAAALTHTAVDWFWQLFFR